MAKKVAQPDLCGESNLTQKLNVKRKRTLARDRKESVLTHEGVNYLMSGAHRHVQENDEIESLNKKPTKQEEVFCGSD